YGKSGGGRAAGIAQDVIAFFDQPDSGRTVGLRLYAEVLLFPDVEDGGVAWLKIVERPDLRVGIRYETDPLHKPGRTKGARVLLRDLPVLPGVGRNKILRVEHIEDLHVTPGKMFADQVVVQRQLCRM